MRGMALVFCALLLCELAPAQKGGWRAVEGLTRGSLVKIQLRGTSVSGKIAMVSATGLVLEESNGLSRTIAKNQITKVYLMGKAHKLRDGLIGAGVGGIGGFIYGAIIATRDAPPPGYTPPGLCMLPKALGSGRLYYWRGARHQRRHRRIFYGHAAYPGADL